MFSNHQSAANPELWRRWRRLTPQTAPRVHEAIEHFCGEYVPNTEIAFRRIVTILIAAGVKEKQLLEAEMNALAESAIALDCISRGYPTDCKVCDQFNAVPALIPADWYDNLLPPVLESSRVRRQHMASYMTGMSENLKRISDMRIDIIDEQPDWPPIGEYRHLVQEYMVFESPHMLDSVLFDFDYYRQRLAQVGFRLPDEWTKLSPRIPTEFDKIKRRIVENENECQRYRKIAEELHIRAWRMNYEPDDPLTVAGEDLDFDGTARATGLVDTFDPTSASDKTDAVSTEPITYEEIVECIGGVVKTVQNAAIEWKKANSHIGPISDYSEIRPLIVKQWPKLAMLFPADYREFREGLIARRQK